MRLVQQILVLLNFTALILLFIYIFIYPLYSHSSTQPQSSYNDHFLRIPVPETTPPGVNCSKEISIQSEIPISSHSSQQIDQGKEEQSLTENELLVEKIFLEHLHQTQLRFLNHPGHKFNQQLQQQAQKRHGQNQQPTAASLEDYMHYLSQRDSCHLKPIFLTMARVSSELYWQLIENYFYTMSVELCLKLINLQI
jgi:hypothetical protein